jgi:hypothetical protein
MKLTVMDTLSPAGKDPRRWVTPEALNVAPQLAGQPLATPLRRALAIGVDLALIALLSDVGGFWLVAGLALVALLLRGPFAGKRKRVVVGWIFAGVLGLLALQEAWDDWGPNREAHRKEQAAEAAAERQADLADAAAEAAAGAAETSASAPGLSDAQRIERLQAEIAELRKPHPFKWREQLNRLIDSVGVSFGWGVVYFSLLPAWWNGQTLGKKLFHLRIVELTGKPLTVMRCLRRYGGYAAGMATGGLGFLQALRDVNRQGIQDRVAHTVVLDLRAAPREVPQAQGAVAAAEPPDTAETAEASTRAEPPDQAL